MVLASTSRSLEQVCVDFLTKTPDTKLRQLVEMLNNGDGSKIIQSSVMQTWTNCSFVELSKKDHQAVQKRIPATGLIATLVSLIHKSQTLSMVVSAAETIANLVCDYACVAQLLMDAGGVATLARAAAREVASHSPSGVKVLWRKSSCKAPGGELKRGALQACCRNVENVAISRGAMVLVAGT